LDHNPTKDTALENDAVSGRKGDSNYFQGFHGNQIDLISPPSTRSVEPVIQRAPGGTRNAINSAMSLGSQHRPVPASFGKFAVGK
jgi:hypothetical protein